jgi:quinol monooxygenase YgiN
MTYALLNKLTAQPGERDAVIRHLLEAGASFEDDDACLLYLVMEAAEPDVVWVVDLWTSEVRHADALTGPDLRPHVEATMPLLKAPPEQIEVRPRGGKGPG